jgi:hypothetical protein
MVKPWAQLLAFISAFTLALPPCWCCSLLSQSACCRPTANQAGTKAAEPLPEPCCCCTLPSEPEPDSDQPSQPSQPERKPCCERASTLPSKSFQLELPALVVWFGDHAQPDWSDRHPLTPCVVLDPGRLLHLLHCVWLC